MPCSAMQDLTNLGMTLAVGDINGDGRNDLIVGSPLARGDPSLGACHFLIAHL